MAWNHQLDDNPLQKPFFFQFSDSNLKKHSPGFRQLQISPVEIWVGRWLFDIWIRPSSTLVVILPRVWQKIMPGGTNPMQLGVQNLVCHGTWVYGKLRETWGFLVDYWGYNEIQWEENCILKLWSYTFSEQMGAGIGTVLDETIEIWESNIESKAVFSPWSLTATLPLKNGWERKTRTFPFGFFWPIFRGELAVKLQGGYAFGLVALQFVSWEFNDFNAAFCCCFLPETNSQFAPENGCFQKSWYPQIIHFNRVFHYKPSILGYPYFWKHPNRLSHKESHLPTIHFQGVDLLASFQGG